MSDNSIRYSLSWPKKIIFFLVTSLLTLLNLFIIVWMCWVLLFLSPEPEDIVAIIIVPVGVTVFFCLFTMYVSNLEPDIQTSDKGLKVQFFWFWWIFIPWEDVEEIRVPLFGLSRFHLIVSRKLTFVHRIIGAAYLFKPVVLISPDLERQSELVATIKKHINM